MPLMVKILPVSAEQDPMITVAASSYHSYGGNFSEAPIESIASNKNATSELKPKKKSRGTTLLTVTNSSSSRNDSRNKSNKTDTSRNVNNTTSIKYKITSTIANGEIPITEEFAPSALENESDNDDEQHILSKVHWTILFILIAPLWCVLKAICLPARMVLYFDKYKNPNGRAGKNSVNFFLTLTLLAFIAFFMLIGNTKLNGNYKDSTNDVRISSLPGIRELYAEEANKFKREFHKLTLQATKKVLSHPYELVRYGVGVEININYKWKQLHCNKKTSIFKNGVCAVEKSKKAKRSANQHNKFNRTIEY